MEYYARNIFKVIQKIFLHKFRSYYENIFECKNSQNIFFSFSGPKYLYLNSSNLSIKFCKKLMWLYFLKHLKNSARNIPYSVAEFLF